MAGGADTRVRPYDFGADTRVRPYDCGPMRIQPNTPFASIDD